MQTVTKLSEKPKIRKYNKQMHGFRPITIIIENFFFISRSSPLMVAPVFHAVCACRCVLKLAIKYTMVKLKNYELFVYMRLLTITKVKVEIITALC